MNSPNFLLFCIASLLFFGCKTDHPEHSFRDNTGLPYIGQHDVLYEDMDGYKAGDTLFHTVPDFEYLTQDSSILTTNDIDGKIWIAKFFFSHCPTICPPMTSAMKEVNQELAAYSEKVTFLSFSIDPDRDDPARLRTYMKRHDIIADNWYFLTGDESATHQLGVQGFQVLALADDQAPGGFAHSPNFVLVDEQRHIRGVYDGLDPKSRKQLIKDVLKLIENE